MTLKLLGAAAAASVLVLSGCANWGASGGGTSDVPRSSQAYPTGSTATPSGHSPGQGSGTLGTATADFHTFDTNRDGNISRQEWDQRMRDSGSAGSGSSVPR